VEPVFPARPMVPEGAPAALSFTVRPRPAVSLGMPSAATPEPAV
jgi:hypothetical protein